MKSLAVFSRAVGSVPAVARAALFNRLFAPDYPRVAPGEAPERDALSLNGLWQVQPVEDDTVMDVHRHLSRPEPSRWQPERLKVPSPWNINSFSAGDGGDFRCYPSYPAAWEAMRAAWLRRVVSIPKHWKDKRVVLRLAAVAGDCEVIVNGASFGRNLELFLPRQLDITQHVRPGDTAEILLGIRRADLFTVNGPLGSLTWPTGSFWGLSMVGPWQDIDLLALPRTHLREVYLQPRVSRGVLDVSAHVDGPRLAGLTARVHVREWKPCVPPQHPDAAEPNGAPGRVVLTQRAIPVKSDGRVSLSLSATVLKQWTMKSPRLYVAVVQLYLGNRLIDTRCVRFGWREWTLNGAQLLLNGEPVSLYADSWHFMGVPQMSRRYAWAWFSALKAAGGNAVRLHAQPFPEFYLDVADEMGIAVLDETAIWASHCAFNYDRPEFWTRCQDHVRKLVLRDRNHASVMGWSVANEIVAALGVRGATDAVVRRVASQVADLADMMRRLDPSRPWISSDGDETLFGRLPVSIVHYGDAGVYRRLASEVRPWGVGEASSAYYSTPAEVAGWFGPRAYQSVEGRMEGIAVESWRLLTEQRKLKAAWNSIFNVAWYALQPLPIGLRDISRPPTLADGVTFPAYREGIPGVQPERLGPWSTTFNPGYDPALPMYRPWPLYQAVAAAWAQPCPRPIPWRPAAVPVVRTDPPEVGPIRTVTLAAASDSAVFWSLRAAGVPIAADADTHELLIVDSAVSGITMDRCREMLLSGRTVVWWATDADGVSALQPLLPGQIAVATREASCLRKPAPATETRWMNEADLYGAHARDAQPLLRLGMTGVVQAGGQVLLEAHRTDWRRWNDRPENIKTASVFRSEVERQPECAALARFQVGAGRLYVLTLNPRAAAARPLMRRFCAGLGVRVGTPPDLAGGVADSEGVVRKAMVLGPIPYADYNAAAASDPVRVLHLAQAGEPMDGEPWRTLEAEAAGWFDLRRVFGDSASQNAAAWFSVWIHSPRPLDELLAAPDVPRVGLSFGSDDGARIWLNGALLYQDAAIHPLIMDAQRIDRLPLRRGWNHLLVCVAQGWGEWQLGLRITSSDPQTLGSLRVALHPEEL